MKNDFPRIHVSPEVRRKMVEIAREYRKAPTPGEKILREAWRGKRLDGIKLRRQQPIGYFVVDFYPSAYRLVVEGDGPIHESQKEADQARQQILEELELVVLRIISEVVEKNLPVAVNMIRQVVRCITQNNIQEIPCPFMGEGKGRG